MSIVDLKMKKKILDSDNTGIYQILPIKYHWAREYYKSGIANTWTPEEISMQLDSSQWKSNNGLTEQERRIAYWSLGFFATAESLTANNIVLAIYKHVQNAECRQYLLRQSFEEALHTDTFIYCCDSLSLDLDRIYNAYVDVDSIKSKDEFVVNMTKEILDPFFVIKTEKDIQLFIKNIIGFYVIMEGIFFYAGFAQMLYLRKLGKMVGVGQQFEYIMRDESIHLAFGCDLINTIKDEYPTIWTDEFKDEIVCTWTGRFKELKDFHELALQIAEYYNAIGSVLPEASENTLIQYFNFKKSGYYLTDSIDLQANISKGRSKTSSKKGLPATTPNQRHYMDIMVEESKQEVFTINEEGFEDMLYGYTKIRDIMLLTEMSQYKGKPQGKGVHDGNYDRIISYGCALTLAKYFDVLYPTKVIPKNIERDDTNNNYKHLPKYHKTILGKIEINKQINIFGNSSQNKTTSVPRWLRT